MPRAIGQVTTSATTTVPINATTYNEQTSGAQRSVKSSSANDTAAGTGARKVKVVYYTLNASTGAIAGPYIEEVTLNGTTAVAMTAEDVALVERLEVSAAGSGGVAAGTITLYAADDGTGTAIASIATGEVRTFLGHHYVASGKLCRVVDIEAIGGDAAAALVQVQRLPYPAGVEQTVTGPYGTTSTSPRGVSFAEAEHSPIPGPCRLRLTVTPGNGNAQTTRASFGWVDETMPRVS